MTKEHTCIAHCFPEDEPMIVGSEVFVPMYCNVCGNELEAVYEYTETNLR